MIAPDTMSDFAPMQVHGAQLSRRGFLAAGGVLAVAVALAPDLARAEAAPELDRRPLDRCEPRCDQVEPLAVHAPQQRAAGRANSSPARQQRVQWHKAVQRRGAV